MLIAWAKITCIFGLSSVIFFILNILGHTGKCQAGVNVGFHLEAMVVRLGYKQEKHFVYKTMVSSIKIFWLFFMSLEAKGSKGMH